MRHIFVEPNNELTNRLTKQSKKILSYHKLKTRCLDKRILRNDVLTPEEMWKIDGSSEDELDIQYRRDIAPTTPPTQFVSDYSENVPLVTKYPSKITPSELHFSIEDKTNKIIYNNRNLARKFIARKAKKPRNTLVFQWSIISDGKITNYSPHTITIETPLRNNTVIPKKMT